MDLYDFPCFSFYDEEEEQLDSSLNTEFTTQTTTTTIETNPHSTKEKLCPCCTGLAETCRRRHCLSISSKEEDMTIIKILAEGWLQKKGSGNDWLKTTKWKYRWAQLALTTVPGYDVDVPVLHLFWHPSFGAPSTSINLDGKIVTTSNVHDVYSFDIVFVNSKENCRSTKSMMMMNVSSIVNAMGPWNIRTFATSELKDRNEWITQINRALYDYEKRKNTSRVLKARPKGLDGSLLPRSPLSKCTMTILNGQPQAFTHDSKA